MPRRALFLLLVPLVLAGCEFGERAIAAREPRPAVHAVLDPFSPDLAGEYVVLLERTLTGQVATDDENFDPDDPIVSGGGDPIPGAVVQICVAGIVDEGCPPPAQCRILNRPRTCAIGIEDASVRSDGKGRGVYRFVNQGCTLACPDNLLTLQRGERYALHVLTPGDADRIVGATTIPSPILNPDTRPAVTFDRDRDSVRLAWPASQLTPRYAVQIQTPYGPYQLFSIDSAVTLRGDLVNVQSERLSRVFTPGFRHDVQFAAVDTNYFDYYRSANDPFTGLGIINRLRGGTGVFGAYVSIRTTAIEAVGTIDQPHEGVFAGAGERWALYDNGPGLVSGRVDEGTGVRRGVLGTRTGTRLRLAVLEGQRARDTLYVASAEVRGDTLVVDDGSGAAPRRLTRLP